MMIVRELPESMKFLHISGYSKLFWLHTALPLSNVCIIVMQNYNYYYATE